MGHFGRVFEGLNVTEFAAELQSSADELDHFVLFSAFWKLYRFKCAASAVWHPRGGVRKSPFPSRRMHPLSCMIAHVDICIGVLLIVALSL